MLVHKVVGGGGGNWLRRTIATPTYSIIDYYLREGGRDGEREERLEEEKEEEARG